MNIENKTNKKKKIFFIAVTDEENSKNRAYSDFVYEICYYEINHDSELKEIIDLGMFKRHDMETSVNIKKSLYEALRNSDAFIVLLDMYDDGYNPNVWFELGAISNYDKPIILIAKEKTAIPFHVNDINVIRIPEAIISKVDFSSNDIIYANIVDDILRNRDAMSIKNNFSKNFIKTLKCSLTKGNPFLKWYDSWEIESLGYQSLTNLFEKTGIINFFKNPGVRAEFISSERDAFVELIAEVNKATTSLRTTRFANQSIVSGKRKNNDVHNEFMNELYSASRRSLKVCDRIVCNNEPSKWDDILQVLVKSNSKMKVFVRQAEYRTGFELVIIDEKVAFIHFYQIDNHGDTDDNGDKYTHEIEVINSTLKIYGETVCKKLANIFDRLHHIDFDTDSNNPSRTLLGIPKKEKLTLEESNRGFFQLSYNESVENDVGVEREKTEEAIGLFINALKTWNFENTEDKINMATGICLLDRHFEDDLKKYFNENDVRKILNEVNKRRKKK